MTEPVKLPKLKIASDDWGSAYVCSVEYVAKSEALEVIRRCEMHDRLVLMLEKATGILEAEFSQQADPSPDDACYIAEQCRAILKENQ